MMSDKEFLEWIYRRLVRVHGEEPNIDYMLRLAKIIKQADNEQPKDETKGE